jgi:hypothetical protein
MGLRKERPYTLGVEGNMEGTFIAYYRVSADKQG